MPPSLTLLHLLPAAVCGCGFLYFLCEAAEEQRTLAERINPSRRALATHFVQATICLTATLVSLAPVMALALGRTS